MMTMVKYLGEENFIINFHWIIAMDMFEENQTFILSCSIAALIKSSNHAFP